MSEAPEDLQEIYIDELKDLYSANDQMQRVLKKYVAKATDPKLKSMLEKSNSGIEQHTTLIKDLLAAHGEKVAKDHCKGMEGLVAEAKKHALDDGPDKGPLLDVIMIAQYQRMSHYGIAGFGTAAAFAAALGHSNDDEKLKAATKDIYGADQFMTHLAESSVNLRAEVVA